MVIDGAGRIAVKAEVDGPGLDFSSRRGIWRYEDSSGLQLVVRPGEPAPGLPAGSRFSGIGTLRPYAGGKLAFAATVQEDGTNSPQRLGLWGERDDGLGFTELASLNEVVFNGETTPLLSFDDIVVNSAGEVAFAGLADIERTGISNDDTGIWSNGGGAGLRLVAQEGGRAPGTPDGVVFREFGPGQGPGEINKGLGTPILNAAGQVAFLGKLEGPGVRTTNDTGIWAETRDGTLELIVREGDLIDANDDPFVEDLRQVFILELFDDEVGTSFRQNPTFYSAMKSGSTSFNDRGELAFLARFRGRGTNRGIFVSSRVAVPEPTAVGLLFVGLSLTAASRRL